MGQRQTGIGPMLKVSTRFRSRIIIFNIITLKVYSGRPFKRGGVIQGLSLLRPICQVTLSFMNEMYVASCRWGGGICVLYHYSVWRYLLFYCDTPKPAILRPIRIEITIRKVCAQNPGSGVFTRRKPGVFHAVAYKILHFLAFLWLKTVRVHSHHLQPTSQPSVWTSVHQTLWLSFVPCGWFI